jgi:hypothetical protein
VRGNTRALGIAKLALYLLLTGAKYFWQVGERFGAGPSFRPSLGEREREREREREKRERDARTHAHTHAHTRTHRETHRAILLPPISRWDTHTHTYAQTHQGRMCVW